jgi:hypothetical protein
LADWVRENPADFAARVDLAVATAGPGDLEGARALMHVEGGTPVQRMRFEAALTAENATRDGVAQIAREVLGDPSLVQGPGAAALLDVVSAAVTEHEICDLIPQAADGWYRARGDAPGYIERVSGCLEPAEAASRLDGLRDGWGPRGERGAWTALVKAGRKPFELLYRDLDLALVAAQEVGAELLLLDYPNPSPDHRALRDVLGEYASSRPVHFLDQWSLFDTRFDEPTWMTLLGPNGHCNADGYRIMGDELVKFATERGLTRRSP